MNMVVTIGSKIKDLMAGQIVHDHKEFVRLFGVNTAVGSSKIKISASR
jgi:hypothetical protein